METNDIQKAEDDGWMSPEERAAILGEIERLPETAREMAGEEVLRPRAKRRGALFPVLVNVAALAALAGGFLLLSRLHSQDAVRIRENQGALGVTERRLIQEIRKESAGESLSREELAVLLDEQSKVSAAEAQLGGLYRVIEGDIQAGRFEDAEKALNTARDFLNAPDLRGSRSWENTRRIQSGAVAALEALLEQARQGYIASRQAGLSEETEKTALQSQIALLEQQNQEQAKTIEAFGARGDGLSKRIAELESNVRKLQAEAADQQNALASRDAALGELRSRNAASEQQIAALRGEADAGARQIAELQSKAAQNEREIAGLNSRNAEAARRISDLQAKTAQDAQQLSERDKSIAALRAENSNLAGQGEKQRKSLEAIGEILNGINNTTVSELPARIDEIRRLVEQ